MNSTQPPGTLRRSNLHTLTIVVLLVAFLALALGQWASGLLLYGGSFEAAERRDSLARARHAQAIMWHQADFMRRDAGDNAAWDDSYRFMLGMDPTLPDRLFAAESHRLLRLSAFAFVARDGAVKSSRQYDGRAGRFVEATAAIRDAVGRDGDIGRRWQSGEDATGIAQVAGRIFAWGAAPVTHSDGGGPPVGYLVLLSELDSIFLADASSILDSKVALVTMPAGAGAGSAVPAHTPVAAGDLAFSVRSDSELQARFCLAEFGDGRALDLTIVTSRVLHATEVKASLYFLWSTILFGTALTAFALWFIERRLLRPVQTASEGLVQIGSSGDLSMRLAVPRYKDQVGSLVEAANLMLAQLESKREIEASRDAAVAESRLKSEFLARMSHEIRTPMNGVLGMTELLGRTPLSAKQLRFVELIRQSGGALLQVITDILDFSKIEAGRFELDVGLFDLGALVGDVGELLANEAHSKGVELRVNIGPSVPPLVVGDSGRVRQVLLNLISNAVKFTERGAVTVETETYPAAAGVLRLQVTVRDSGVGIPPEALLRIFEPFGQADTTVTRKFGGTGLGLSIARHLAKLMGGDIRADSVVGCGSVFVFSALLRIPIDADGSPEADSAVSTTQDESCR
jgi:signal transduction histidine kinase